VKLGLVALSILLVQPVGDVAAPATIAAPPIDLLRGLIALVEMSTAKIRA
jgi:hypothetical protein